MGRLGVLIHCTAGYVDPGFYGTVTLEIRNVGPRSIKLRAGMPIAQLRVWKLDSPPLRGYGHAHSKYYGQVETQPAKSLRRTHEGNG